jgi:hypothetical protein
MTIITIDIDECASGLHNCSSLNNWICENLMPPEKFLCECKQGFIRESDTCEGKEMFSKPSGMPTNEGHVIRS